jgi:pSer/pThr/pTyr-binding forkhead associated (FHA) protein
VRVPESFTLTAESSDGRLTGDQCSGREIIVGRGVKATMSIRNANLARSHCRFELRDDGVYVQDAGSTGGIYTEDQRRITRPHRLANGERVMLLGELYVRVSWTE